MSCIIRTLPLHDFSISGPLIRFGRTLCVVGKPKEPEKTALGKFYTEEDPEVVGLEAVWA